MSFHAGRFCASLLESWFFSRRPEPQRFSVSLGIKRSPCFTPVLGRRHQLDAGVRRRAYPFDWSSTGHRCLFVRAGNPQKRKAGDNGSGNRGFTSRKNQGRRIRRTDLSSTGTPACALCRSHTHLLTEPRSSFSTIQAASETASHRASAGGDETPTAQRQRHC